MSIIQTSRLDNSFGISGEKLLTSSINGEIFEIQNIQYILYTDTSGSIIVQQINTDIKITLYTNSSPIIIQNLQIDNVNNRVWVGGYFDKPMRGFIAYFDILVDLNKNISFGQIQIKMIENLKTIEVICILDKDNIIFSGISKENECWILHNNYKSVYNILLTSTLFSVKDIRLVNRQFYIFIETIDLSKNKIIQTYIIPNNTLISSFI